MVSRCLVTDITANHNTSHFSDSVSSIGSGSWMTGTNASVLDLLPGMTSKAFHISLWLLTLASILGNIYVIMWRCSRKEYKTNILSLLVTNLAFADLLWSSHYLLLEIMVLHPIFKAKESETFTFTETDRRMCFSSAFLAYASCNAIMFAIVAIALYSIFSVRHVRHGSLLLLLFVLLSWTASFAVAASATSIMKR